MSCADAGANLIAYLRADAGDEALFLVVGHFGGATRQYKVGVPRRGWWHEVINSNSEYYGGSGLGNDGGRTAVEDLRDGYTQSIDVTLPPLTTVVFKWKA